MMLLGSMWKNPVAVAALMAGFAAVALLVYSLLQFFKVIIVHFLIRA